MSDNVRSEIVRNLNAVLDMDDNWTNVQMNASRNKLCETYWLSQLPAIGALVPSPTIPSRLIAIRRRLSGVSLPAN